MGTKTISICSSFLVIFLVASLFSFFANQNNGFFAYASEGDFIDVFATGDGLDDPHGLVFGPDKNLYVVSQATDEVLRYNGKTGAFIDAFVTAGSGGLDVPFALDFGPDGNLYVSSCDTDEVLRYDGDTGDFIDVFAFDDVGCPTFIFFGPDENLYVINDLFTMVDVYDGDTGDFLDDIAEVSATSLIFGPDGLFYIANDGDDSVIRFNLPAPLGNFTTAGAGGLDDPHGLFFGPAPELNLYVVSRATDEVLRYSGETGDFIDVIVTAGSGGLDDPYGLVCGPDGNLYVSSNGTDNVLRYEGFKNCVKKDGGGGSDYSYLTKPTFGLDHKTDVVIVEGGFSANGKVFDVTDNRHTDFEKQAILVGETNSFSAKASSPYGLKTVEFMFGIPNVGAAQAAKASIQVTIDVRKIVVDVQVNQKDNFINEGSVSASARPSICKSGDAYKFCVLVIVSAIFNEALPPANDVFALKGIDFSGRDHTTYLNEGFQIFGDSLNPATTLMIAANVKGGDGLMQVTQIDKEYDIWVDEAGNEYERNSFDSFIKTTVEHVVRDDPMVKVMTRMNSNFETMKQNELDKATKLFDSSLIQKVLPDSYSIPSSERLDKLQDPEVQLKLFIEEMRAEEKLNQLEQMWYAKPDPNQLN